MTATYTPRRKPTTSTRSRHNEPQSPQNRQPQPDRTTACKRSGTIRPPADVAQQSMRPSWLTLCAPARVASCTHRRALTSRSLGRCAHRVEAVGPGHTSAAELAAKIQQQVPCSDGRVRALLRATPCVTEVYHGRWQVGRAATRAVVLELPAAHVRHDESRRGDSNSQPLAYKASAATS